MLLSRSHVLNAWTAYIYNAMDHLRINFSPWSRNDSTSNSAALKGDITIEVWKVIGGRNTQKPIPVKLLGNEEILAQVADTTRRRAIANDIRADWDIANTPLAELHTRLNQVVFPKEWSTENASLPSELRIIWDTYLWVQANFRWDNPVHKLALVTSMLFLYALPHVAYAPEPPIPFPNLTSDMSDLKKQLLITQWVVKMPWVEGRNQGKGLHQPDPFLIMVVSAFIAYFEKESPLRKALDGGENVSDWMKKHSKLYECCLCTWVVKLTQLSGRCKIHYWGQLHSDTAGGCCSTQEWHRSISHHTPEIWGNMDVSNGRGFNSQICHGNAHIEWGSGEVWHLRIDA